MTSGGLGGPERLRFRLGATSGAARSGTVETARGSFATPCFMPVGTRGAVKALSSRDLEELGCEVLLANTYHLMLRPGVEVVRSLGGLHSFASWEGHLLTDSGGFQVFSLSPAVGEDSVRFRSVYDGSLLELSPEAAVRAQEALGSDIQMVLDVCAPHPSAPEALRSAVDRTASWAARAKAARRSGSQAMFGIVQGGVDASLRRESAERTVEIGFEGYAVGGLSVGEGRREMLDALGATVAHLPRDRPRYLMGLGDPLGLLDAVSMGVDMFDCVLPTRLARHGTVLTWEGRLSLANARYATDDRPLDPRCGCDVCSRWSRGYLRHLLRVGEPSSLRLLSIHNLSWILELVRRARRAIGASGLDGLRHEVASAWECGRDRDAGL